MLITEEVQKLANDFISFINTTGSPYHSVLAIKSILKNVGFVQLDERLPSWNIVAGGRYYITRNSSSIGAFVVGSKFNIDVSGFCIAATHTDSPCLRLRPNCKSNKDGYQQGGVECYGGGLWHTWFDRGLGLAGKVILNSRGNVEKFVRIDKPVCIIPNLAIHLKDTDEIAAFKINKEDHLQPIICTESVDEEVKLKQGGGYLGSERFPTSLLRFLSNELRCDFRNIMEWDLCLMDATPSRLCGLHEEFIESPRLDNQFSTYACMRSLADGADQLSSSGLDVCMVVSLDNEEVGSESANGANSNLVETWISRILAALNNNKYRCMSDVMARSFLVSADMAHAVHPNYPNKHQDQHKPQIHRGIVFKENSNQRYASNAQTMGLLRFIADSSNVPTQNFVVRNDFRCGSTVGPILSAKLGIRCVDVGAPQLAMHSCREMCGVIDMHYMCKLIMGFFLNFRKVDSDFSKHSGDLPSS